MDEVVDEDNAVRALLLRATRGREVPGHSDRRGSRQFGVRVAVGDGDVWRGLEGGMDGAA